MEEELYEIFLFSTAPSHLTCKIWGDGAECWDMLSCLAWTFVCALGKGFYGLLFLCPRECILSGGASKKDSEPLWILLLSWPVVDESPNNTGVIVIAVIGENELFSIALTQFLHSQPAGSLQTSPHASEKDWICKFCSWVYPWNLIEPFTFIITKVFVIP